MTDTTKQASSDQVPAGPGAGNSASIVSVVLVYAAFASLWILLSDRIVALAFTDPVVMTLVATLKGWLFVAITSLLLYGLLRRRFRVAPGAAPIRPRQRHGPYFALAVVFILALAGLGVVRTVAEQQEKEGVRLQAIADLKTRQIGDWLRERRGDAEFLRSSVLLGEQYHQWQALGDARSGKLLTDRLAQWRESRGFGAVMLLDPKGERLWGTADAPQGITPELQAGARRVSRDGQPGHFGPYRNADGQVRLDFITPLSMVPGAHPLVVLQVNAGDWLFPSLQRWPGPSATGETLLFRRDGDHVLFLNELRHRKASAANLRVSLENKDLLASRLLRGEVREGALISGRDYRDVPVIGVIHGIPGTDWFLVAKIDRAELYEDAVKDAVGIGLVVLLALFVAGAGNYVLRQRQDLLIAEQVRESQAERLRALSLLDAIAESSQDAIFAKDLQGRYLLFNRAACNFVGKPVEAVLGKDDRAIFPPNEAEMLMGIGREVLEGNCTVTREELLSTPGGERVFLSIKAPLRDSEGKVVGLFGISRDMTARREAERAVRASEERLQLALDASSDGIWDLDVPKGVAYLAPRFYEMSGYRPEDVVADFGFFKRVIHPDEFPRVAAIIADHLQGKTAVAEFDFRLVTAAGKCNWVRGRGRVVQRDADGAALRMVGTITDIEARKRAEDAVLRQTEELALRNAELERFNRATVGRELEMIHLKQQVNELSARLGEPRPFPLDFLDPDALQGKDS